MLSLSSSIRFYQILSICASHYWNDVKSICLNVWCSRRKLSNFQNIIFAEFIITYKCFSIFFWIVWFMPRQIIAKLERLKKKTEFCSAIIKPFLVGKFEWNIWQRWVWILWPFVYNISWHSSMLGGSLVELECSFSI